MTLGKYPTPNNKTPAVDIILLKLFNEHCKQEGVKIPYNQEFLALFFHLYDEWHHSVIPHKIRMEELHRNYPVEARKIDSEFKAFEHFLIRWHWDTFEDESMSRYKARSFIEECLPKAALAMPSEGDDFLFDFTVRCNHVYNALQKAKVLRKQRLTRGKKQDIEKRSVIERGLLLIRELNIYRPTISRNSTVYKLLSFIFKDEDETDFYDMFSDVLKGSSPKLTVKKR